MKKQKILFILFIFLGLSLTFIGVKINNSNAKMNVENLAMTYMSSNTGEVTYLSDIDYIKNQSFVSYDQIRYDEVNGGGKITIKIENNNFTFTKGIWAHATSQLTYDISNYDYKYFTAYVGLNTSSTRGDGVDYIISTSQDGEHWESKFEETKTPGQNASFVKVDVAGVKYLRLVADDKAGNGQDHSVYADAKLVNEVNNDSAFLSVEKFDELIKKQTATGTEITKELEFTLLKREFIKRVGQYTLNVFYNESDRNKDTIDWLMNNQDVLNYYILGGTPSGGYYNSLTQLSRLYYNYKDDFNITTSLNNKWDSTLTYGDLYKRMAISLSLTHGANVGLWMNISQPENKSDALQRYAIYRYMHKNNLMKATDAVDITPLFESLKVEEMRFVMNNLIDDEEILWLNAYVQSKIDAAPASAWGLLTPHPYMAYVWPNYGQDLYYSEENKDYFNELFAVPDKNGNKVGLFDVSYTIAGGKESPQYTFKVTRGTSQYKLYKVWMNFRNKFGTGAVCGGISKTGSNIRATHGIPATVIGQPGHAALLYYSKNSEGKGYWGIDNDVSGWNYSEKGERMLLDWGYGRGGYNVPYIVQGQEALNDYDNLVKAEELLILANAYSDNPKKQEELYRQAIKAQSINLDAWKALVQLYLSDSTKTEEDYYKLAEEMLESVKYFPLAVNDLANSISPKFTSDVYKFKFTLLQTRILTEAKNYNGNDVVTPGVTRTVAAHLLGNFDSSLATFSFDGEDAGKIILSSRFDGSGVRWDYSLDGKKTWKEVSFTGEEEHKWQLTKEEISKITSENDIYVHIVGANYSEENLYKIDILESEGIPSTVYANDLENKLIAAIPSMQWKFREEDEWNYFGTKEPDLTGDKSIIVRAGATGVRLVANETKTYTFTTDTDTKERKYIPISHLSLESVSSEATSQGRHAVNALDGNLNTSWHSAWNGSDKDKFFVIKLDEPKNLTALEYAPLAGGNGKILSAQILVSEDGEIWTEVVSGTDWTYADTNDVAWKSVDFDAMKAQYIKIVGKKTQSKSQTASFMAAAMFNLYENPEAKIIGRFSFDGSNPNEIVLLDSNNEKDWEYSIDGGDTWKLGRGNSAKLSTEEIESLTVDNGIKIRYVGEKTIQSITLSKAEAPEQAVANDLENRLIGISKPQELEWRFEGNKEWTSYEEEPIVNGDKTLQVRIKASGLKMASEVVNYQFTSDNQPDNRKYISIKNLSIHAFSTQSQDASRPHYAPNAIDGNPNTEWHTHFAESIAGKEAFITIKLNSPKYISGLDYLHLPNSKELYGYMKKGIVYVSEDAENWKQAAIFDDVAQDDELKSYTFDESVYGQYVKLVIESHDNVFATAAMINLYEDTTKKLPGESIKYNVTTKTNQDVVATLLSSDDITITNNDGKDTYTFTKNGSFTFEYTDKSGNKKTQTAVVDWIDKKAPTGTINYSIKTVTPEDVTVTLETNEPVKVTNNGGKKTYIFKENGTFTFEFEDEAGNKGEATAEVTWINKSAPTAEIEYSTTKLTNQDVTVTLVNPNKEITITNNNGKNTYTFTKNGEFTFEFADKAGNVGKATAKVNNIDKVAPTAEVKYSTTTLTNGNVIATLVKPSEEITITNNNGKDTYTFTQNGTFTFEFTDKAGNVGKVIAKVNNIDKVAPTAEIKYSTTTTTNGNVIATLVNPSKEITITNNNGKDTYTFSENGIFTFEFTDKAGNKGSATAIVNNIKKVAPTAEIEYSTTALTNKDVVATLTGIDKDVTITNNNGKNTYTFKENGVFTFEFTDKAGNIGRMIAKVDWIDKKTPTAEIEYSTTAPTNKDVTVTLVNLSEEATITNNNGKNTYTFTQNGEFTFEFIDKAGNVGKATAKVNNIRKITPIAKIEYSLSTLTNQDVIAKLVDLTENVAIKNNDGKNSYIFKENGEFTFELVDEFGNIGKTTAKVDWIDKIAPTATVQYDKTTETTGNVVATLVKESEPITILNNDSKKTYVFKENGTFEFKYRDKAGNIGKTTAKVNWIKKDSTMTEDPEEPENPVSPVKPVLPTAEIKYSTTVATNKDVTVKLVNPNKKIKILNNGGKDSYIFKENGTFTFEFIDEAGYKGKSIAKVNWIDKKAPEADVKYNYVGDTLDPVVATLVNASEDIVIINNNGKKKYTFKENGTFEFIYKDKAGNIGKTVAKVDWIVKESFKPVGSTGTDKNNTTSTIKTKNKQTTISSSRPGASTKKVKVNNSSLNLSNSKVASEDTSLNNAKVSNEEVSSNDTKVTNEDTSINDTNVDNTESKEEKKTKSNNPFQNYDYKKDNIYLWMAGGVLLLIIFVIIDGNRRRY